MKNGKMFNMDLTMTENCNFRCSYCFEEGMFKPNNFEDAELFIKRVNEFLDSSFFEFNYEMLSIYFWGGEPTLNKKILLYIFDAFKDNDKVIFMIYSNGYKIDSFIDYFEEYANIKIKDTWSKIHIQISYDGAPIHDLCRRTKDKKLTSEVVKNTFKTLQKKGISTSIKSTLTLENFQHLPEARRDLISLNSQNYAPSIEYYKIEKYSKEEVNYYLKVLEKSLIEIAKDEIKYYKKHNHFYFRWFNNSKSFCSAGKDVICIDIDGKIYKCHGTMYEDTKNEHYISSLRDFDMVQKIQNSHTQHSENFKIEPEECKNCTATFCLRCNAIKFQNSKKDKYIDRWRDYTSQSNLCQFYILNGKIVKAIDQIIKENK